MINLLPQEEKRLLARIYRGRLLVVTLSFLLLIILAGTVFLIPSYLAFKVKNDDVTKQLAIHDAEQKRSGNTASEAVVKDVQDKIARLSSSAPARPLSEYLAHAVSHVVPSAGITLSSITLSSDRKLSLQGVAATRLALLAFIKTLQGDGYWSEVNSPISNLVSEARIQFSLTLTPSLIP